MPPEIVALIDKTWLLAMILAIGAACGMAVERFVESQKRAERRAYWQGRNTGKRETGARRDKPAISLKGTPERARQRSRTCHQGGGHYLKGATGAERMQ